VQPVAEVLDLLERFLQSDSRLNLFCDLDSGPGEFDDLT